jgi:NAD(P)-dependent dehydrogenase (short-subunit alcohol dehydrogenase family)
LKQPSSPLCCVRIGKKRGGGAIVHMGSMWALQAIGATPSSAYSAANAGVHSLVHNLALEQAADKIRINTVAPAVVETPIYSTFLTKGSAKGAAYLQRSSSVRPNWTTGRRCRSYPLLRVGSKFLDHGNGVASRWWRHGRTQLELVLEEGEPMVFTEPRGRPSWKTMRRRTIRFPRGGGV